VEPAQFFRDAAAGKTASQARSENRAYYDTVNSMSLSMPLVVNHPEAVQRGEFIFYDPVAWRGGNASVCLVACYGPYNLGQVTINGTEKMQALVLNPNNYEDLDVVAGNAVVLGGFSSGQVHSHTPHKLELAFLENSGDVEAWGAESVVIASVRNSGSVTVGNTSATLINVTNTGNVFVNGTGSYSAFDIVNTGYIEILKGDINLSFNCNTGGTVKVAHGVTGSIE